MLYIFFKDFVVFDYVEVVWMVVYLFFKWVDLSFYFGGVFCFL